MKITDIETGENLQIIPGTKLSVERTNPFFNDYGEQTVPVDIPASPYNCRILGHPEAFGVRRKAIMRSAVIQDGEYYAQCRQAVLSATRRGSISTSFYMSDGSLYSRIGNIKLRDIYGDERIAAAGSTVASCIAWCKTLVDNTNPDYTIFPVLLTDDSNMDTGWNFKILNNYGCGFPVWDSPIGSTEDISVRKVAPLWNAYGSETPRFDTEEDTVEYVDGIAVNLKPGYYISPFVRAVRVLRDVFAHFGYSLEENFFTRTEPFSKMAVVNKCIDTIVNGYILKADLVPDVTCKDFLAVFRRKFCCEFIADERDMTVSVAFLGDMLSQPPSTDLTGNMTAEPTFSFKSQKDFRRVKLSSEHKVDQEASDSYDSVKELQSRHETAVFCYVDGAFYKRGWKGLQQVETKIAESSMDYDIGDEEQVEEVSVPDLQPEYRILRHVHEYNGETQTRTLGYYLYVGDYVTRHSKLKTSNVESDEEDYDEDTKASGNPCILAFSFTDNSHIAGTAGSVSAYNLYSQGLGVPAYGSNLNTRGLSKIWDYSLFYWGPDGVFEKFYRQMDLLRRNALNEVKVKLLLSAHEKMNIPVSRKVCLRSEEFFLDKLKFTLGGKDDPLETTMLTVSPGTPLSEAASIEVKLHMMTAEYHWETRSETTDVTWVSWLVEDESPYHGDGEFHTTVYPPLPCAELVGSYYAEQSAYIYQGCDLVPFSGYRYKYKRRRVWLVCVHN